MFIQRLKEAFKQAKSNKGFSLVELLVVIGILGILMSIAIPSYNAYQENAKRGVDDSILQTALRTIQINQSLGTSTDATELSDKIKSKGVAVPADVFVVNRGNETTDKCEQTANTISEDCTKWCVGINVGSNDVDGGSKTDACINNLGTIYRDSAPGTTCSLSGGDTATKKKNCEDDGCTYIPANSSANPAVSEACTKTNGTCGSGGTCS